LTAIIRRTRSEESGYLTGLTIRSKAHWGYEAALMEALRDELEFQPSKFQPDSHVYILEENGERLGFCSLIPIDPETIELHDLFLDPGHIGKGYGRQLWSYAVNLARDLGYFKLILTAATLMPSHFTRARVPSALVKRLPQRPLPVSSP
jgi:GNAT superfamily N-acetyltransferase